MSFKLPTIEQVFNQYEPLLRDMSKRAADITSEGVEGDDPGSMPGSENDKKAPKDLQTPDPEVVDDTVGGTSNYSGDGAEAGSDNPDLEAQLLEADEPVLTPDKKPLDSTDVDAKTASSRGNDLVSFVMNHQRKEAASKAQAPKQAKAAEPAPAAAPVAAPAAAPAKQAQDDTLVLTNSIMSKIAAVVLANQEGRDLVQRLLSEAAGEEFAKEAMDQMGLVGRQMNEEEEMLAAFEKGAQDASELLNAAADGEGDAGDAEEAAGAADAEQALGDAAEAQGAEDASALLEGAGEGDAGDAEEAAGAADAEDILAGAGDGDEGGEEVDEGLVDELQDLLERAETGDISEEEAEMLSDALDSVSDSVEGGDEGGDDDGSDLGGDEDPGADEAAGAADAEQAIADAAKEASVKRASDETLGRLAASIQRFRAIQDALAR